MKPGRALVLCVSIALLFSVCSCITGTKVSKTGEGEVYYGTWGNKEYGEKIVINADGTYEHFFGKSERPRWYGTFIIVDRWKDKKGNVWYKTIVTNQIGVKRYTINKIESRNTLEMTYYSNDFPETIDPSLFSYGIYYRE
jgi:hypothetical protein